MDELPKQVAVNCQRPVRLFGKGYRWVIETENGPLKLRRVEPPREPSNSQIMDFVMRGPRA